MSYGIYEILCFFLIYSFLGWCIEVGYQALNLGKFVNRGFLNGPVCPIYGVGGVIVILCLTPLKNNTGLLFLGSMAVTSFIELITGFALEKIYHARWWDYSKEPFNIGGYICLKFSLAWGAVGVMLMKTIHPTIYKTVKIIPEIHGKILLTVLLLAFLTDCVVTVLSLNKLSKRIKLMNEIAGNIRKISDTMGRHIYEGAMETDKIYEEISEKIDIKILKEKKELDEIKRNCEKEISRLKEKYAELTNDKSILHKRILKAFPSLKHSKFNDELEKIKENIKNRREHK